MCFCMIIYTLWKKLHPHDDEAAAAAVRAPIKGCPSLSARTYTALHTLNTTSIVSISMSLRMSRTMSYSLSIAFRLPVSPLLPPLTFRYEKSLPFPLLVRPSKPLLLLLPPASPARPGLGLDVRPPLGAPPGAGDTVLCSDDQLLLLLLLLLLSKRSASVLKPSICTVTTVGCVRRAFRTSGSAPCLMALERAESPPVIIKLSIAFRLSVCTV